MWFREVMVTFSTDCWGAIAWFPCYFRTFGTFREAPVFILVLGASSSMGLNNEMGILQASLASLLSSHCKREDSERCKIRVTKLPLEHATSSTSHDVQLTLIVWPFI